jgi:ABC-type cobalamin/Fe3+-siderophores transport system ATPase subunit
MGSSGAGKTTLLDVRFFRSLSLSQKSDTDSHLALQVLANRKTVGVIGGDRLVAGRVPGREFQRGTAYVEQQDTHEHTQTVREAFRFSAYLRQPSSVSKEEKDRYVRRLSLFSPCSAELTFLSQQVEEVIQLLELEDKADAMIGFPGFGLDVEARKRVTIGVELASKPQLLLFLDEPTSFVLFSLSSVPATDTPSPSQRSRWSIRLQHRSFPPQARRCRSSRPLYHPPTELDALRKLRPSPPPQGWWTHCLLRRHRQGLARPSRVPR